MFLKRTVILSKCVNVGTPGSSRYSRCEDICSHQGRLMWVGISGRYRSIARQRAYPFFTPRHEASRWPRGRPCACIACSRRRRCGAWGRPQRVPNGGGQLALGTHRSIRQGPNTHIRQSPNCSIQYKAPTYSTKLQLQRTRQSPNMLDESSS